MKIGFLGGGKMAEGILAALGLERDITVAERVTARAAELASKYGVKVTPDVRVVAETCELVFLAVRPQDVAEVAAAVKPLLKKGQTLVSIVAGKTRAALRKAFGGKAEIVRVMPNLALRVGEGMCAVCGGRRADDVVKLLSPAGRAIKLAERDFDAVTALSGSGPAYFAYMLKAMQEGGEALGLKRDVAHLLAQQTMFGTAKFLRESRVDLDAFIDGVCTRGGTTAAGMAELAKGGLFKQRVAKTLAASAARSRALAGG